MPICKKCGTNIPNYIKIDGKMRNLSKRKFCLSCSPFGMHNTRNICNGNAGVCSVCGRGFLYDRHGGHRATTCSACMMARRRKLLKQKLVSYKGGKCEICGYGKCVSALEFHHINPNEKEFTFSRGMVFSYKRLVDEVDKCMLLCANCHREIHAGRQSSLT